MLDYSYKLTLFPWDMKKSDVEDLKKAGFSDKEILVEYQQKILATEEDLEAYMAAMKKAYQIVLRENKKIALS